MSSCYEIACQSCEVTLWIGQWGDDRAVPYLYFPAPLLERFLFAHVNHPLVFVNDDYDAASEYRTIARPRDATCDECELERDHGGEHHKLDPLPRHSDEYQQPPRDVLRPKK